MIMTDPPISDPRLLSEYWTTLAAVRGMAGVTGVDIGFDFVDGEPTDPLRVRVHGTPAFWSTEFALGLPETVTPITATYRLERASQPGSPPSGPPIRPGMSVGNVGLTGGTLG